MKKIKFLAYTILTLIVVMFAFSGVDASVLSAGGSGVTLGFAGLVGYNREIFKELQAKYKDYDIAPSFLRVEAALSNSKGEYTFDVMTSNGVDIATEKKLNRNDVFIATQVGLFLTAQEIAKIGKEVLKTWPDTSVFSSTSTFTPEHLNTIYSGYLWMKINTKVAIENLCGYDFRKIGVTAATEFNREEFSRPLEQYITISGNNNNELKYTFPTFTGMQVAASASGYSNKLVLMFFGFLARGVNK